MVKNYEIEYRKYHQPQSPNTQAQTNQAPIVKNNRVARVRDIRSSLEHKTFPVPVIELHNCKPRRNFGEIRGDMQITTEITKFPSINRH